MDLLFAVVVGVVIALLVVLWRRGGKRAEDYAAPSQDGKPRFETTMNELRDMREALRTTLPGAIGRK